MTKKGRRKFGAEFKAKVVLEALKERSTIEELARKYELHPTQINTWKKEAVPNMAVVFGAGKEAGSADLEKQTEKRYAVQPPRFFCNRMSGYPAEMGKWRF
jgi:transposase